ncbi:response regulator [Desulfurispirillum indicum]|uniref:Response regulator receiver n=1 Tax=Desulfurispirillum indicum (strain ATCC BAA-1389 / DSM 22839 / S5) TaxID=653733 RepID=E6W3V7_DESIS|nr:HD domain-containing phosphohydrolase [Desulfurispirillum indicum]ADU65825.1 response regulator receiver [Desulfurispirillum indicum S5]UCZ57760.1 response regulator [Desulfurispirillum indicum]
MNEKITPSKSSFATTILIAEDSRVQRKILDNHLQTLGYNVLSASDGVEALEIFRAIQPRVVITDLEMPNMDGFELIRQIRKHEIQYTHITVLSSLAEKENIIRAISLGASDYLVKPFHPDEMRVRLEASERLIRIQSQERIILLMAKLTDYRSPETGFHIERVQHYTRLLAQDLAEHGHSDLNNSIITTLFSLSSLHDIGKVAIPDEILNKPGKLTTEEFELMKEHVVIGGTILDEAYQEIGSEFLRIARDIVLYHHERFDGFGYPYGLKGNDIPISARIVALADVFDALSSERCYKPAFPREQCYQIILEERGLHFDPEIVDAFLRNEEEFWLIRKQFPDS